MLIKKNSVPDFLFEKPQPKKQTRKNFLVNNPKKVSNNYFNDKFITLNKKNTIGQIYDMLFKL